MDTFMKCDLNIEKIRLACFVRNGEGAPIHLKRPSHGFAFYMGDGCCFCFGDRKFQTRKNDIIYLPQGSDYTVEQSGETPGISCYAINFELADETVFPPFVIHVKNATKLLELFKRSEFVWRTKKTGFQMECKANLYHIICTLQQELMLGYTTSGNASVIESAISYIDENYTNDTIGVGYLAKLCGVSETYFRSLFKKVVGVSPLKYINDRKISRAKELISSKMYSIREVAQLAGFHDEAYFSREFKKATGVCPSKYFAV